MAQKKTREGAPRRPAGRGRGREGDAAVIKPASEGSSQNQDMAPKPVDLSAWHPKTELGGKVKNREILNIDEILDNSLRIMEPEIVDALLSVEQDLLMIGQSKGKFGGGARRIFRQTQKKTMEGNKPKFSALAIVGDKNGHIGLGLGKSKETVPAREKAIRKAKLNIFKIRRGCGSWQCNCGKPHSLPFNVTGKCGSIEVKFMPAPKGKGLCAEPDIAKILALAGIKDIWAKTRGQTRNRVNFIYACEDALRKLMQTKIQPEHLRSLAIAEGSIAAEEKPQAEEIAPQKSVE